MNKEQIADDAYDAHLEAGEAMDALLHVEWQMQPEYGEELVKDAIENFEVAIEHLEELQDAATENPTPGDE